jgi:ATP-binding protein involved in chromosome partitioning
VPVLGMVENISYFMCPHCGDRSEIFSHERRPLGSRTARHRVSRCSAPSFSGEVLLDPAIRETRAARRHRNR